MGVRRGEIQINGYARRCSLLKVSGRGFDSRRLHHSNCGLGISDCGMKRDLFFYSKFRIPHSAFLLPSCFAGGLFCFGLRLEMRDALYFAVWTDEVEKKATVGTRMVLKAIDTCNFNQKPCSKACSPFPPFRNYKQVHFAPRSRVTTVNCLSPLIQ